MVNKDRPVTLHGISFCTTSGKPVVTESDSYTFCDYEHMEKYIQARRKFWANLFGRNLSISANSQETISEKQVVDILRLVCKKTGVDFKTARTDYRGRTVVEARRITMAICNNRKLAKRTIGKALRTDHSNTIYHINQLQNLCDTDREYRRQFLDIEDYVLIELGGEYKENGSGEKLKP
jgi:G:T-mismatch repair DNA endonuclease (very short patch repair protein)